MTCCSHPKCGLHLDDAVGSGALQLEAMVQSQVRRVQQTGQGQRHHAQWALILRLLHLVAQHQRTLTLLMFRSQNSKRKGLKENLVFLP